MIKELIDSIPLTGALIITICIVLVSNELGFRLGVSRKGLKENDGRTQIVSMTGAHLGLLAFILAFSFSMAAGHFSDRKQLLLAEVNAIETAFLRAALVPEPQSSSIRSLLSEYTGIRTETGSMDRVNEAIVASEKIQVKIWQEVKQISIRGNLTVMDSLLVQSINSVYDLHQQRINAGKHSRNPASIWLALYVILILSMIGMGFSTGLSGKRSPVASIALALSFSMVMYLIADLDRPRQGLVVADQSLMVELKSRLDKLR